GPHWCGCLGNTHPSRTTGPQRLRPSLTISGSRLAITRNREEPLYMAGRLNANGQVSGIESLPARARALLDGTVILQPQKKMSGALQAMGFRQVLAKYPNDAWDYGLGCSYDEDDVVALRDYLAEMFVKLPNETVIAKLACYFDALVYGGGYQGDLGSMHARLGVQPPSP
ncbi:hypothetical protein QOZ88_11445, partial [Blastococcus sp. BMG 814]